jgi:hypothetical protein
MNVKSKRAHYSTLCIQLKERYELVKQTLSEKGLKNSLIHKFALVGFLTDFEFNTRVAINTDYTLLTDKEHREIYREIDDFMRDINNDILIIEDKLAANRKPA